MVNQILLLHTMLLLPVVVVLLRRRCIALTLVENKDDGTTEIRPPSLVELRGAFEGAWVGERATKEEKLVVMCSRVE